MAIYPVLFNQYLAFFFPDIGGAAQWITALAVIWTATGLNLRGAGRVGRASVLAGAFILGTFLLVTIAAIPNITHVPWEPFTKPENSGAAGLGVGLSIALWNYIGWDNASTVQGEVVDASRSYPKALAVALPMIALGYLVPLSATLAASDWTQWKEGGWPDIARMSAGLAGEALAICLALAGMLSAIALFNALLLTYSRVPLAMSRDGFLPPTLARLDARGTPRNAVLVSAVFYSVFATLSFAHLVVADVLLYSMALFLEFAALIALRRREPGLRGAFRIPLGTRGVTLLALVPALVLMFVTGVELKDGEYGAPAILGAMVAAALGPVGYVVAKRGRGRRTMKAF